MPGINDAPDGESHQGLLEPRPTPASRHRARPAVDDHSQPDRRRAAPVWRLLQPAFALSEKAHAQKVGCQRLATVTEATSRSILPHLVTHLRFTDKDVAGNGR